MKNIKITAVNKPRGTITVMWDEDPQMEWNYNIPLGDDGVPLGGEEIMRWLIAFSYDSIKQVRAEREEKNRRDRANFDGYDTMLRHRFNVEKLVREYEHIRGLEE
jgi:hypothetical protein